MAKQLRICFFNLATKPNINNIQEFKNGGCVIYRWKRSWEYLSINILHAPKKFKFEVAKNKNKICSY